MRSPRVMERVHCMVYVVVLSAIAATVTAYPYSSHQTPQYNLQSTNTNHLIHLKSTPHTTRHHHYLHYNIEDKALSTRHIQNRIFSTLHHPRLTTFLLLRSLTNLPHYHTSTALHHHHITLLLQKKTTNLLHHHTSTALHHHHIILLLQR
ncbi:hypothetical protein AtEden1_Chr5g0117771 [Arabidopsis thaliana]